MMIKKIEMNNTYGYENFITNEEQIFLLEWVEKNVNLFVPSKNGDNRKFYIVGDIKDTCLNLIQKIKNRVIDTENIKNWIKEPNYKDYIGINETDGFIHQHTDANINGYAHVRYNIILKYPIEGGHSIYNDTINVLKEKMVWRCVAGKVKHGSTPVIGEIPRITLSLGFQIKNEESNKLI